MLAGVFWVLLVAGFLSLSAGLALSLAQRRGAPLPADDLGSDDVDPRSSDAALLAAQMVELDLAAEPSANPLIVFAGALAIAAGAWLLTQSATFTVGVFVSTLALFHLSISAWAQLQRRKRLVAEAAELANALRAGALLGRDPIEILKASVVTDEGRAWAERASILVAHGLPREKAAAESFGGAHLPEALLVCAGLKLQPEAIDGPGPLWDRVAMLIESRREVRVKADAVRRSAWVGTGLAVAVVLAVVVVCILFVPQLVLQLLSSSGARVVLGLAGLGFIGVVAAMHLGQEQELDV